MIIALEVDADQDLRPVAAWLQAHGVPHRIFESGGRLRVAVPDEQFVELVQEAVRAARDGRLPDATGAVPPAPGIVDGVRSALAAAPATAALVVLTLVFFPATWWHDGPIWDFTLRWLMIVPIERVGDFVDIVPLGAALRAGEFWHLWTPALLHFGLLHIAFNLLWLWEFGRRIEIAEGRFRLLEVVLVLAPVANGVQYALMDGPLFGGLSGVVYGLLGYIVTAQRRRPHPAYRLHGGLVVMLLLFLVLFSTGVTKPFGLNIANGAHWGGLAAGVLWALIRVWPERSKPEASLTP